MRPTRSRCRCQPKFPFESCAHFVRAITHRPTGVSCSASRTYFITSRQIESRAAKQTGVNCGRRHQSIAGTPTVQRCRGHGRTAHSRNRPGLQQYVRAGSRRAWNPKKSKTVNGAEWHSAPFTFETRARAPNRSKGEGTRPRTSQCGEGRCPRLSADGWHADRGSSNVKRIRTPTQSRGTWHPARTVTVRNG